jgi:hypothetical protein
MGGLKWFWAQRDLVPSMCLDSNEFQMTTVIKVVGEISSSYSGSENGELKRTFEVHCDLVSLYGDKYRERFLSDVLVRTGYIAVMLMDM